MWGGCGKCGEGGTCGEGVVHGVGRECYHHYLVGWVVLMLPHWANISLLAILVR